MMPLTKLEQLKTGTRLKIVGKDEGDSYEAISVVKLIPMIYRGEYRDTEILINKKQNYYFSFEKYIEGKSNWVKEVYVLEDKK